jgi:hypothetical protein
MIFGPHFRAELACYGNILILCAMDSEDTSSTRAGAILNAKIQWTGDRNASGIKIGFTDKPQGHHRAVGMTHPIDSNTINTIFAHKMIDDVSDIADIVDAIFRRNSLATSGFIIAMWSAYECGTVWLQVE